METEEGFRWNFVSCTFGYCMSVVLFQFSLKIWVIGILLVSGRRNVGMRWGRWRDGAGSGRARASIKKGD